MATVGCTSGDSTKRSRAIASWSRSAFEPLHVGAHARAGRPSPGRHGDGRASPARRPRRPVSRRAACSARRSAWATSSASMRATSGARASARREPRARPRGPGAACGGPAGAGRRGRAATSSVAAAVRASRRRPPPPRGRAGSAPRASRGRRARVAAGVAHGQEDARPGASGVSRGGCTNARAASRALDGRLALHHVEGARRARGASPRGRPRRISTRKPLSVRAGSVTS